MQMSYPYLPFKNFCKLAKQAERKETQQKRIFVMITHSLGNAEINRRYQSEEFSCLTNAKVYAYSQSEQILCIQIAKLKKFSTLKNSPCPLTQSIKVHRRALVLLPCLIPCRRCDNSQLSPFLIMQRDNIHARTHDTCVD